jgi:hypothetical protein
MLNVSFETRFCAKKKFKKQKCKLEVKNFGLVFGQRKLVRDGLKPHVGCSNFQLISRKEGRGNAPASNSLEKYTVIHPMKPKPRPSRTMIIKITGTLKQHFF